MALSAEQARHTENVFHITLRTYFGFIRIGSIGLSLVDWDWILVKFKNGWWLYREPIIKNVSRIGSSAGIGTLQSMGSTLKGTISIMMNKLVFLILKIKPYNFLIKVVYSRVICCLEIRGFRDWGWSVSNLSSLPLSDVYGRSDTVNFTVVSFRNLFQDVSRESFISHVLLILYYLIILYS